MQLRFIQPAATRESFVPIAARALALFFGGFSLLNLLGNLRRPGFDATLWWIDLRILPTPLPEIILTLASLCLLNFAFRPPTSTWLRRLTTIIVGLLAATTVWNALEYYSLLFQGRLESSDPDSPVPRISGRAHSNPPRQSAPPGRLASRVLAAVVRRIHRLCHQLSARPNGELRQDRLPPPRGRRRGLRRARLCRWQAFARPRRPRQKSACQLYHDGPRQKAHLLRRSRRRPRPRNRSHAPSRAEAWRQSRRYFDRHRRPEIPKRPSTTRFPCSNNCTRSA